MSTNGASAARQRRVGATTSATRTEILDAVEQMMIEDGYASVSYRRVGARVGVTGPLVQYYFPTLDDLFIELLHRRTNRNYERLTTALAERPDEPLRVIWEFSSDEANGALTMEFMALANHRKRFGAEVARTLERTRKAELAAITAAWNKSKAMEITGPESLLFVLAGIPHLIVLEEQLGTKVIHREAVTLVEDYLDRVEPRRARSRARRAH